MYSTLSHVKWVSLTNADSTLPPDTPEKQRIKYDKYLHKERRHHSWCTEPYPEGHGVCTVPRCKSHCDCLTCPLYLRLRTWMPPELKYCGACWMYTKRDKRKTRGAGKCEFFFP